MKIINNIYKLSLLAIFIGFSSCDDALDVAPESYVSSSNFYKNSEEVNLAIVATYSSLYTMLELEWNVTEMRSDNTFISPDRTPDSDIDRFTLDRLTVAPTNRYSSGYYRACYSTIALANRVLENLEIVQDLDKRNQFEGEARFLRAHAYFNLVRLFGPVPIVETSISGQVAKTIDRSPEKDVYDLIARDLIFGAKNLPPVYGATELGRVTKWAAEALLGKVYLTTHDYPNAEIALENVLDQSPNTYLSNYADVFNISNEYNPEILFAVRYQSGSIGLGAPFANYFAPLQSRDLVVNGDGKSLNVPTEDISNAYGFKDVRKNVSMSDSWINANNQEELDRYIKKYNSDFAVVGDAGNDWPILRYTDVLLMLSETYVETKTINAALDQLNIVRERAKETPYQYSEITSTFQLKLALENERRLEFAFENQRWFDLLRTGRAETVINQHFASELTYNDPGHPEKIAAPIQGWQLLLPIPQYEIDLNPNIAQNIGY